MLSVDVRTVNTPWFARPIVDQDMNDNSFYPPHHEEVDIKIKLPTGN